MRKLNKNKERELKKILKKRNKIITLKFPTKSGKIEERKCEILKYVIHRQSNAPQKYFILESLKLLKSSWKKEPKRAGKKELRIGYYILGKRKNALNKWIWGQYAPLIPLKDLRILLHKAKSKGLI